MKPESHWLANKPLADANLPAWIRAIQADARAGTIADQEGNQPKRPASAKRNLRPPPEIVNHHSIVIHINYRTSTGKFFYTVAKDAMRVCESREFETEKEIYEFLKV